MTHCERPSNYRCFRSFRVLSFFFSFYERTLPRFVSNGSSGLRLSHSLSLRMPMQPFSAQGKSPCTLPAARRAITSQLKGSRNQGTIYPSRLSDPPMQGGETQSISPQVEAITQPYAELASFCNALSLATCSFFQDSATRQCRGVKRNQFHPRLRQSLDLTLTLLIFLQRASYATCI